MRGFHAFVGRGGRRELSLEPVGLLLHVLVHVTDGHVQRAARFAAEIIALADVGRLRLAVGQTELAGVKPGEQLGQLVHQFELGCRAERRGYVTLVGVVEVNGHEA